MRFIIHADGSFDLIGEEISLLGCYPALNGAALRPVRVERDGDAVRYTLPEGAVTLRFAAEPEGRTLLSCEAESLSGVHDFAPVFGAAAEGAERVFVQGLGMEGPSGRFSAAEETPVSYGLAALYNEKTALLAYAEDHSRYTAAFLLAQSRPLFGEGASFSGGFNLEGTAGARFSLPVLCFEEAADLETGLRRTAERIAAAMGARHDKPPAFFWSSWYHAYETLDQATLEARLQEIREESVPFQYIEIDAGYTPHCGDWLTPNHRWPGGLEQAAETIRAAGFRPGIWVAPFVVGDGSELARQHPDWLLRDRTGAPVVQLRSYTEPKLWGNPDCDYYVLDTSHPEALAHIEGLFETLKSWGFSFFKTDFLFWNHHDSSSVRRHDPSLTSVEILRNTLTAIRRAIGEDSYLLGCIAPFLPLVGIVDGMRIAGDCGARWAAAYGPVNLLSELPCDSYFNHVYWQNDPDAMMLRDFDTQLTPAEVRSLTFLQALSGGAVSTSDPVGRMGEDRKRLLRFVQPHGRVSPFQPRFGAARREIALAHRLAQGNLLFVMNPTDAPLTVFYPLRELFGPEARYCWRYDWEGTEAKSVAADYFSAELAPHDSALLFVTGEPLMAKPENLWVW